MAIETPRGAQKSQPEILQLQITGRIMSMKENARFRMIKRVETKDDGRFIIYYDFESCDAESDSAGADCLKAVESKGRED